MLVRRLEPLSRLTHLVCEPSVRRLGLLFRQLDGLVEALVHRGEARIHLTDHVLEALVHRLETLVHRLETLIHRLETLIHRFEALIHRLEAVRHESEPLIHQHALRFELLFDSDQPFEKLASDTATLHVRNHLANHLAQPRLDVLSYATDVFVPQSHGISHRHLLL